MDCQTVLTDYNRFIQPNTRQQSKLIPLANCVTTAEFFGVVGVVAGLGINLASTLLPVVICFVDGDGCVTFTFGFRQDAGSGGGGGGTELTPATACTEKPSTSTVGSYTYYQNYHHRQLTHTYLFLILCTNFTAQCLTHTTVFIAIGS